MRKHDKSDDSGDSDYSPDQRKKTTRRQKAKVVPAISTGAGKGYGEGTTIQRGLPTPGLTPTDRSFSYPGTQVSLLRRDFATDTFHASSALNKQHATGYTLDGMLSHDDEALKGNLGFSRRGARYGHCSRDTADLWMYILRLFFPETEGYVYKVQGYEEQQPRPKDDEMRIRAQNFGLAGIGGEDSDSDGGDEVDLSGGDPVGIVVSKWEYQWNPMTHQWFVRSTAPVLAIICGSEEDGVSEYPAARQKVGTDLTVPVTTKLQQILYTSLTTGLETHNQQVAAWQKQGRTDVSYLRGLSGAVACGSVVRFFRVKDVEEKEGWWTAYSKRGLDMINGDPSAALSSVESVLKRVKNPAGARKDGAVANRGAD